MKLIKLFFLFLLLTTTILNAEYLRSIRLGSFPTQEAAERSLQEVNAFIHEHYEIVELMQENEFQFKSRMSGKYYITLVEPFRDREVLQTVLDVLRLSYPDIYVTKLKSLPMKEERLDVSVVEEKAEEKTEEKNIPSDEITLEANDIVETIYVEEESPNELDLPKERLFETPEEERVVKKELIVSEKELAQPDVQESASFSYAWLITFIEFFIILILIRYTLKYKKENETYINKEMIYSEKLNKVSTDVTTKDKLLSHVSHELRTPMTAIMGLTHLVLESELTKLQKDYILKIESSSEHLLNLINDILDVSKIQAGELKLEKSEFNINDIFEYVFSVNAMNAKRNATTFSMDVALDIPSKVVGDSLRLGQVLINLIGNAVKFTHDGEVSLSVRKVSAVSDTIKLEFSVIDTGIGMTEEQVNNIFNSYYQAEESTSREFGGTGLGLAISKELVEMMGGEIKVSSEKGVGTTFTFSVVLKLKDPENKRYYRLPSSSMLNKKILIVDSSNKNVISLIKSLGYFNYKTNAIPSFEESVIENQIKFDIVIINQYNLTKQAVNAIYAMKKSMNTKLVVLNEIYSGLNKDILGDISIDAYLQVPSTQQSVLNMIVDLYVSKNLDKRSRKTSMKDKLKVMSKKKILIAEDNDVNQKVILGLLSQTGIELTFVDDGHEALDLVKKDIHFDLVIMDINMPKMNGYEAAREIRKTSKYNSLPILALTGDVTDEAVSKARESGMQGHISKPIIIDIFYKKIFDALNAKTIDLVNHEKIEFQKEHKDDGYNELSISVGLARCEGDKEFYKSILKDFKSMYINSAISLEELCNNKSFKEARRMSMDIKDVALNIGAYNLCESAAGMEYEFEKGERSNWRELISYYENILNILFKDIDKYLKEA